MAWTDRATQDISFGEACGFRWCREDARRRCWGGQHRPVLWNWYEPTKLTGTMGTPSADKAESRRLEAVDVTVRSSLGLPGNMMGSCRIDGGHG